MWVMMMAGDGYRDVRGKETSNKRSGYAEDRLLQEYTVGGMDRGDGAGRGEDQNVRNVRVQGKDGLSGMGV